LLGLFSVRARQEVVDPALWVSLDDPRDRVAEAGLGVDGVELAGFDQRGDDGAVFGAAVGAGAGGVPSGRGDGPDRAPDSVGVDLDGSVVNRADGAGSGLGAR
jgi:hypothetical protein